MGRWVIFADQGSSCLRSWNADYAVARAAATGYWMGAMNAIFVGQGTYYLTSVFRGKLQFPTLAIPPTDSIMSASIWTAFQTMWWPSKVVRLCVVSGIGLSPDTIHESDFGILFSHSSVYGSIDVPIDNFPANTLEEILLNAGAFPEILKNEWTRFGLRSSDDIDGIAPTNDTQYCELYHGFDGGFQGMIRLDPAVATYNALAFNARLAEDGIVSGFLSKLVLITDGLTNGSSFDVCFGYGTKPPPGEGFWEPDFYTPWQLNKPLDEDIVASVSGLPAGHYYYNIFLRWPNAEQGTVFGQFSLPLRIDVEDEPPPPPLIIGNSYSLSRRKL